MTWRLLRLNDLLQKSNFFTDILVTFTGLVVSALLSFLSQGVAARLLDKNIFGEYLITIRIAGVILPVVMLGAPVAAARYLGLYRFGSKTIRGRYIFATTAVVICATAIFTIVYIIAPAALVERLLGASSQVRYLVLAILLGSIAYTQVYAIFRGVFRMFLATALAVTYSSIPLITFLVNPTKDLNSICWRIGSGVILVSTLTFIYGLLSMRKEPQNQVSMDTPDQSYVSVFTQVLFYGIPRVPGFIIAGLLFSIGTFLLARQGDMVGSASVNAGVYLLSLASFISGPIGIILLPRGSSMVGQGKQEALARLSKDLLLSGIHLGAYALFQWAALGAFILSVWLQFDTQEQYLPAVIVCLALPFFLIYDIVRNLLDSLTRRPLNLINQSLSLATFLGVYLSLSYLQAFSSAITVAISTALSYGMLGILTAYRLIKELNITLVHADLAGVFRSVVISLLCGVISGLAVQLLSPLAIIPKAAIIILVEVMVGGLFLAQLYLFKIEWVMNILKIAGRRKAAIFTSNPVNNP